MDFYEKFGSRWKKKRLRPAAADTGRAEVDSNKDGLILGAKRFSSARTLP